jgi:DNA-directed RNA polymerase I subunit RPA1
MTKGGGFTPFNRNGMKSNVSPFMKMSFETTVGFLRDAVLERDWDDLSNPSARIVVGRLGGVGTGSFDVLAPVTVRDPLKMEQPDAVPGVEEQQAGGEVEMMDVDGVEPDAETGAQQDVAVEADAEAEPTEQESPKKKKSKKEKKEKKHRRESE